jgi:hypothetical protein
MGQVAQVEAEGPHSGILDGDRFPIEMRHPVRFLVVEHGTGSLTGFPHAQAFEEDLPLVARGIHRVEENIKVVAELFGEHGENLLVHRA